MPNIPVADFMPDAAPTPAIGSSRVTGVVPIAANAYGPFKQLEDVGEALPARCLGSFSILLPDLTGVGFVGTAETLNMITGADYDVVDKSGDTYTATLDNPWMFEQVNNRVIALNYNDSPQVYDLSGGGDFEDLITSGVTELQAGCMTQARDWLVFGNTIDNDSGSQPQRLWWSAQNDPRTWPIPSSTEASNKRSGYQTLTGPHGTIRNLAGSVGNTDLIVFTDQTEFRGTYVGAPKVFDIRPMSRYGIAAPQSLVKTREACYWFSYEGVKSFSDAGVRHIGLGRVDEYIRKYVNVQSRKYVRSTYNSDLGVVVWGFPASVGSTGIDALLLYSPKFDKFTLVDDRNGLPRIEDFLSMAQPVVTVEDWGTLYANLDAFTTSIDSTSADGRKLLHAVRDGSHVVAAFRGANMQAVVETEERQLIDGARVIVNGFRALVDTNNISARVLVRDNQWQPVRYSNAIRPSTRANILRVRGAGRYVRAELTISKDAFWERLAGITVDPHYITQFGRP